MDNFETTEQLTPQPLPSQKIDPAFNTLNSISEMEKKFNEVENEMLADFTTRLDKQIIPSPHIKNRIVAGKIIEKMEKQEQVMVYCKGLKAEALVPFKEFSEDESEESIKSVAETLNIDDEYEFYIETFESRGKVLTINRRDVKREKRWQAILHAYPNGTIVEGIIFAQMKGGFCVDLDGNLAFLPSSQVKSKWLAMGCSLLGSKQEVKIINLDDKYKTCIVSCEAAQAHLNAGAKKDFMEKAKVGDKVTGKVKNITTYGAFVDIGIMDGLLHITDITWNKINHPNEVLSQEQMIETVIVAIDKEKERISLGMKQLTENPEAHLVKIYAPGQKVMGTVIDKTKYGLFLSIQGEYEGNKVKHEGLLHVNEADWIKEKAHEIIEGANKGDKIEVIISAVDIGGQNKISFSRKAMFANPWKAFISKHTPLSSQKFGKEDESYSSSSASSLSKEEEPSSNSQASSGHEAKGDIIEGTIKRIDTFRIFITLENDITGIIHLEDIAWSNPEEALRQYREGDKIKCMYLSGHFDDKSSPKISLGVKQLTKSPFEEHKDKLAVGKIVAGIITLADSNGVEVTLFDKIKTYVGKSHLPNDKQDYIQNKYPVGSSVNLKISRFNSSTGELQGSIKKAEEENKDKILSQFNNANVGASLRNVLGDALKIHTDQLPDKNDKNDKNEEK